MLLPAMYFTLVAAMGVLTFAKQPAVTLVVIFAVALSLAPSPSAKAGDQTVTQSHDA